MIYSEHGTVPGRGWGCSPRLEGRSGAGRDARATTATEKSGDAS